MDATVSSMNYDQSYGRNASMNECQCIPASRTYHPLIINRAIIGFTLIVSCVFTYVSYAICQKSFLRTVGMYLGVLMLVFPVNYIFLAEYFMISERLEFLFHLFMTAVICPSLFYSVRSTEKTFPIYYRRQKIAIPLAMVLSLLFPASLEVFPQYKMTMRTCFIMGMNILQILTALMSFFLLIRSMKTKGETPEVLVLLMLQAFSCFYFTSRNFWILYRDGSDKWKMIEYYVTALFPLYYPMTVGFLFNSNERALNSILDRMLPMDKVVEEEIERLEIEGEEGLKRLEILGHPEI